MIIVGIDPGTGVSSPAGFVRFASDGVIEHVQTINTNKKNANERLKDITVQIQKFMSPDISLFCVENFYMRGLGGQTLQRMIGAAIGVSPEKTPIQEVQNTTVKRIIGGTGKADKRAVALGVLSWFTNKNNQESKQRILDLIAAEEWDILDAFAIGISGYQLYIGEVK